jgi:hypothetical protein
MKNPTTISSKNQYWLIWYLLLNPSAEYQQLNNPKHELTVERYKLNCTPVARSRAKNKKAISLIV